MKSAKIFNPPSYRNLCFLVLKVRGKSVVALGEQKHIPNSSQLNIITNNNVAGMTIMRVTGNMGRVTYNLQGKIQGRKVVRI